MITRIFRVKINPNMREEFELKFATVSVDAVKSTEGLLSVNIGKPSRWSPDEYVMLSCWENEKSLQSFAGDFWKDPHIPKGMEKFVEECWVHHYTDYGDS